MKKFYTILFFTLSLCILSCKNNSSDDDDNNTTKKTEEQKISEELVSYQNVKDSFFDNVTETRIYKRTSESKGIQGTWSYSEYEDYFNYITTKTTSVEVYNSTYTILNPNWTFREVFTPLSGKNRVISDLGKYSLEKTGDDFIFSKIYTTGTTIKYKLFVSDKYMTLVKID